MPDLLRQRAAEDPDGVALRVAEAGSLTYGEWDRRSNAAARGLLERGVRQGDRVALWFGGDGWVDFAVGYLAVHKAGAAAVPLGTRFGGPELARILDHAGVSGIVAGGGAGAGVDPRPPSAPEGGAAPWLAGPADLEAGGDPSALQVPLGPDDLAEIIYTSGTTGLAKGVACTQAGIMVHDLPADAGGGPGSGPAHGPAERLSFLHGFPIGTQAGQETLRVPLRIGGRTAIVMPVFDADRLGALVERHRVVRLQLVPAMAQVLVASGAAARHDLSSVRRVILSSAPAPPALFARLAETLPGASLWNAYALTEAGAARTLTEYDPQRPTAVGRPVGRTEVRIVDDRGRTQGPEQTGEVWLRRPGAPPRTYYRDPEATEAAFGDGWVHTGDLGWLDGEGYLYLADRKKDLVISGGSNVSSVEVENALYEHPWVAEAAVFGIAHAVLGEDVAAAVVLAGAGARDGDGAAVVVVGGPGGPGGEAEAGRVLQDFVRGRLAEHKVPHRVVFVEALPRNASGKVLKGELRERFGGAADETAFVAPRTATEATVAGAWAAVLAVPRVGVDDDFFALGGHSLAAAQVAARLQDALGIEVAPTAVFETPTVAELAHALDAALGSPTN